jgi:hypothetical protein
MSQFYNLIIGQSELDEQSSLIGGMIGILRSGNTVTIDPTDKTAIAALVGLENLLDELSVQSDQPAHPDQPDPYDMGRAELRDCYHHEAGEDLDEVFGKTNWDLFDGQEFVANYLGN